MFRLMRLELKKFPPKRYIILSFFTILVSMYFLFVAIADQSQGERKPTFDSEFQAVGMILAMIYLIVFAVLCAVVVVHEYNSRTILLMFTYPLDRKLLIAAKLLLILGYVAISMCAGYLCGGTLLVVLDGKLDLIEGSFQADVLWSWIGFAACAVVACCALGVWTFAVGMITKSVPATIVSALLFFCLRQMYFAATDVYQDTPAEMAVILLVAAGLCWYVFQNKVVSLE